MPSTNYQVTIGERVLRVELRREGEAVFARLDGGDERRVELRDVRGPLRSLAIDDRRHDVLAAREGERVNVVLDGLQYEAEVLDELRARLSAVASASGASHVRRELKAPMPGLVVRVLAAPGDRVEAGQALVVLQAMKMENELSLPRGGTVASVSVEPGATVEQGAVLVVVE